MAYICKDCNHNNNGWCKFHKKQGLKSITQCSECTTIAQEKPPLIDNDYIKEQARVIGKVEALTFLLQLLNKIKDLPAEEQLEAIKNHVRMQSTVLSFSEKKYDIESSLDYIIDMDMLSAFREYVGGF